MKKFFILLSKLFRKKQSAMCCRRFILPRSPEQLNKISSDSVKDIAVIKDMLIYLGKFKKTVRGKPTKRWRYHYTCKHFDRANGICKIYSSRPGICRSYPKKECEFKDECSTYKICNGIKR